MMLADAAAAKARGPPPLHPCASVLGAKSQGCFLLLWLGLQGLLSRLFCRLLEGRVRGRGPPPGAGPGSAAGASRLNPPAATDVCVRAHSLSQLRHQNELFEPVPDSVPQPPRAMETGTQCWGWAHPRHLAVVTDGGGKEAAAAASRRKLPLCRAGQEPRGAGLGAGMGQGDVLSRPHLPGLPTQTPARVACRL